MNADGPRRYASPLEAVRLLVLRGDGLTTTSIETLTGRTIGIRLQGQRRLRVVDESLEGAAGYAGLHSADDAPIAGAGDLGTGPGDELLVRRVHLVDGGGVIYAVGEVVAVLDRLPPSLAEVLLEGSTPLGKAFQAADFPVRRELRRWGDFPVGPFAVALGPGLSSADAVPGRTYRMVSMASGQPVTAITEWFAPRLFALVDGRPVGDGPPANPHAARVRARLRR